MPRRFPIFQFPNRPLIAAMAAAAVAKRSDGALSERAALVSWLVLVVWSAEEVVAGANWFRRLLGVGAGAYALARLKP